MNLRRVLVTGAAGFVGRHAMMALQSDLRSGEALLGVGRLTGAIPPDVKFQIMDLGDEVALRSCIADFAPTHVLHLAAQASVEQGGQAILDTWQTNVCGLLKLADAVISEAPAATFLFVSSSEVYGQSFLSGQSLDENAAPNPVSRYGRSKWIGEQILQDVFGDGRGHLIVLRPFNHIGPGQDERFVAASFVSQIARIECGVAPARLKVGNLLVQREFLDVRDVVRAYISLINKSDEIESGSVFNVASGYPRTLESLIEDLKQHFQTSFTIEVETARLRANEILIATGNSDRLSSLVGWKPNIMWKRTIDDLIRDARERVHSAYIS